MANKTYKQKKQEEEYNKWMRQQKRAAPVDLFGTPAAGAKHINKHCSDCGHIWAWYSSDSGETWQCSEHRRS